MISVYIKTSRIGLKSLTMHTEMYLSESDDLLNRSEMIYVAFEAETGLSKCVPNDIRILIENYERTREIIPMVELLDLSEFQDSKYPK